MLITQIEDKKLSLQKRCGLPLSNKGKAAFVGLCQIGRIKAKQR